MLIIHPHWPPSNTVGVHRVRLIANELHKFNWRATVLTVDERDIEDELSPELTKLIHPEVEVIKVRAKPIRHIFGKRLIGDVGIRAFGALRKKATHLLAERTFHFIWFSVPSWYTPLMGNGLTRVSKVPFGVDYRDPWTYKLSDGQRGLNRATLTILSANLLEPIALKKAALISGVSQAYIKNVQRYKNPKVSEFTFQMGFNRADHHIHLDNFSPPFIPKKRTYVYAGAFSPNWAPLFSIWLRSLQQLSHSIDLSGIEFLFIGTHNPELVSITRQAQDLGLSSLVREIPERLPFLEVQQILRSCSGAMVIGSTEPHYSASKVFQCLITAPRVFGLFHEESEAKQILTECNALNFFSPYSSRKSESELTEDVQLKLAAFIDSTSNWAPSLAALQKYSSEKNAERFLAKVEQVISTIP